MRCKSGAAGVGEIATEATVAGVLEPVGPTFTSANSKPLGGQISADRIGEILVGPSDRLRTALASHFPLLSNRGRP